MVFVFVFVVLVLFIIEDVHFSTFQRIVIFTKKRVIFLRERERERELHTHTHTQREREVRY